MVKITIDNWEKLEYYFKLLKELKPNLYVEIDLTDEEFQILLKQVEATHDEQPEADVQKNMTVIRRPISILDYFKKNPNMIITSNDLINIGFTKASVGVVLCRLCRNNQIVRVGRGKYKLIPVVCETKNVLSNIETIQKPEAKQVDSDTKNVPSNVETTQKPKTKQVDSDTKMVPSNVETVQKPKTKQVDSDTKNVPSNVETTQKPKTKQVDSDTKNVPSNVETVQKPKTKQIASNTKKVPSNVETVQKPKLKQIASDTKNVPSNVEAVNPKVQSLFGFYFDVTTKEIIEFIYSKSEIYEKTLSTNFESKENELKQIIDISKNLGFIEEKKVSAFNSSRRYYVISNMGKIWFIILQNGMKMYLKDIRIKAITLSDHQIDFAIKEGIEHQIFTKNGLEIVLNQKIVTKKA